MRGVMVIPSEAGASMAVEEDTDGRGEVRRMGKVSGNVCE